MHRQLLASPLPTTVAVLGFVAGVLGVEHGLFEVMQGQARPTGVLINAIGPPCLPENLWHACQPAMTLLPSFLSAGITTVAVSFALLGWVVFSQKREAFWFPMLLSIALLLVGGGFVSAWIGICAGIASWRTKARRALSPVRSQSVLGRLWLLSLICFMAWIPGGWILGAAYNDVMLKLGVVLFIGFDLCLPLLVTLSADARTHQQTYDNREV